MAFLNARRVQREAGIMGGWDGSSGQVYSKVGR